MECIILSVRELYMDAQEDTKLKETRAEVAELHNIRKCVDIALKTNQPEQTRTKRHDLER